MIIEQNDEEYISLTKEFYWNRRQGVEVEDENPYDTRAKQVGWKSYEIQRLGFENATNFFGVEWKNIANVLDVGCGYGTLVEYLREEKKFCGEYTGVEIVPEYIKEAHKLYGNDIRNKFIQGNFFTQEWEEKYDIVISLGILGVNHDFPNEYGEKSKYYANKAINLMAYLAKNAMSIYFPNQDNCDVSVRKRQGNMAFYQPLEIRQMIENESGKKYYSLAIECYPDANSVRGIARVSFKAFILSKY